MKTSIYLDNAATTKTAQEVVDAMLHIYRNYGIHLVFMIWEQKVKKLSQKEENRLQKCLVQKVKKFISQQAEAKQITGH